jgi:NAD(P)-dependent dehydrogenase (short-subunit alcohol dehydrogenase family)
MLSSLGFVSSTRPIGARLKILAIGATGGLGRDVVDAAIVGGHKAAALVRDPTRAALPETVEVVRGDVLNPASLTAALDARDAVICALGTPSPLRRSTLLEEGTADLVGAMSRTAVRVRHPSWGRCQSGKRVSVLRQGDLAGARADAV